MKIKKLLYKSALTLTITSFLSYIAWYIRDKLLMYNYWASSIMDIYNASFIIWDIVLWIFVLWALQAAFIPIYKKKYSVDSEKWLIYFRKILTYLSTAIIIFWIIIAIILPYIVDFLVPWFSAENKELYINSSRLMLFSSLLFTFSNTYWNVILSWKLFLFYWLSPILYNIWIIIWLYFFAPTLWIYGIVLWTVLWAFFHFLIRFIPAYRKGYTFKLDYKFDSDIKDTLRLMRPKVLQIWAWQFLLLWFIRLTSTLSEWSTTIYSLARNFQSLPVSLIWIAISTAAFISLCNLRNEKSFNKYIKLLKEKTLLLFSLTALSAITLYFISFLVIDILFWWWNFTDAMVLQTSIILSLYCISIPFESLVHLYARAHYSLENTIRPAFINISSILLIIFISNYTIWIFWLKSIPISFRIWVIFQSIILIISFYFLQRKILK